MMDEGPAVQKVYTSDLRARVVRLAQKNLSDDDDADIESCSSKGGREEVECQVDSCVKGEDSGGAEIREKSCVCYLTDL